MSEFKVALISTLLFLLLLVVAVNVHEFGHTVIPSIRGCSCRVVFDILNISSYKNISFNSPIAHVESSNCKLNRKDINYAYMNGPITEILYYLIVLPLLFFVYIFARLKYNDNQISSIIAVLMIAVFAMLFSSFMLWFVFKIGDLSMLV